MDIKQKILRGVLSLTLSLGFFIGGVANATSSYQAVVNGGFETNGVGWQGDTSSCWIYDPGGMVGSYYLNIGTTNVTEGVYQKLYFPGNATSIILTFKYDYTVSGVGGYAGIGFVDQNLGINLYDGDATSWTTPTYTSQNVATNMKGKNDYLDFFVDNTSGASNSLFIDNVSVIIQTSTPSPVYALSNKKTGSYYYTASSTTYSYLGSHGWSKKGEVYHSFKTSQTGLVPIYSLRNKTTGFYYYTKSSSAYNSLASHGWSKKGIAFRAYSSYKSNAQAIYSLKNKTTGTYYYTKSSSFYNYLGTHGWSKKGVAFYAPK